MRERGITKLACLANSLCNVTNDNVEYDQWTNYFFREEWIIWEPKESPQHNLQFIIPPLIHKSGSSPCPSLLSLTREMSHLLSFHFGRFGEKLKIQVIFQEFYDFQEGFEGSQISLWETGNKSSTPSLLTPSDCVHWPAAFDGKLQDR